MNRACARLWATAALATAAALVAACGSNSPSSSGGGGSGGSRTSNLTVELDRVPNPDHGGIYYAPDNGYFIKDHLNVSLPTPSNAADPIKLVGLNKVDLAASYESEKFVRQPAVLPVHA